jgi:RNA polymerase sigma-70 factor (ECF subfamily)
MPPLALVTRLRPLGPSVDSLPSDAELVTRIRAGESRCEEWLYRRHVGYVHALCLRLLGDRSEAEDATQDTFLSALEDLAKLREPECLKAWLTSVAVHWVHRRFRRRRMLRLLGMLESAVPDADTLPAASGCTQEEAVELTRLSLMLSQLDDLERAAWVLRYVDGHKLEQVAALCKCSLATAKRRIAQANVSVRKYIQVEEPADA